jgi:hypothetical protein
LGRTQQSKSVRNAWLIALGGIDKIMDLVVFLVVLGAIFIGVLVFVLIDSSKKHKIYKELRIVAVKRESEILKYRHRSNGEVSIPQLRSFHNKPMYLDKLPMPDMNLMDGIDLRNDADVEYDHWESSYIVKNS